MVPRPSRLAWRKLGSAKWEDAWVESLQFLGAERVAITSFPGGKTIRIEAFALSRAEADSLVRRFGGRLRQLSGNVAATGQSGREPIRIRNKLVIVDSDRKLAAAARIFPARKILVIPAGAAFGTGEHATTASCLRLLCDLSEKYTGVPWRMLDLGTGSGILAIAASMLGAGRVDAWDFDRDAIRIAGENARINGAVNLFLAKRDVSTWAPRRRWDVVAANLYRDVLLGASQRIAQAVQPGGSLILSGILREQEPACLEAFCPWVKFERSIRSGKWSTLLARMASDDTLPLGLNWKENRKKGKLLTPGEGRDR